MATGIPLARAVSRNAATSCFQDFLSKSAARNQHVSSGNIGINPGGKIDRITGRFPGEMGSKNVVAERDKCLIGAFSAFDFRLAADASDPLISTHRRVASLSALCILPSARKHLLSPSEQAPEERDLLLPSVRPMSPGRRGQGVAWSLPRFAHVRAHPVGWRSPTVPDQVWTIDLSGPQFLE